MNLTDRKILAILDTEARMPIARLAKEARINKNIAHYRIRQLEKKKIIQGYYAIINTHKLGLYTIRVYFTLINTDKEKMLEFTEFLDKELGGGQIFTADGQYDLGVMFWEPSIYSFDRKLRILKERYSDIIEKIVISFFTSMFNYNKKYLGERKNSWALKEEEKIELNKEDLTIIKILSRNARMSTTELAKKLKMPQRTIAYRIKKLEKEKVIMAYRANIDISKLGYENFYLDIYLNQGADRKTIKTYAEDHENCTYASYTLTDADIELETEFSSKKELLKFIEELKEKFPGIKKISYCSTLEYLKISYLP